VPVMPPEAAGYADELLTSRGTLCEPESRADDAMVAQELDQQVVQGAWCISPSVHVKAVSQQVNLSRPVIR
jgi:hypothetical protein